MDSADASRSPLDAAAVCLAAELETVDADAGYVGMIAADGATVEVARVTRYASTPVRLSFPVDAPYPLVQALRSGSALFIADNEQLRCDHPGLVRVTSDDHACATLPLTNAAGERLGAVNFGFEDPHPFTQDELERIGAAARRCAEALAGAADG